MPGKMSIPECAPVEVCSPAREMFPVPDLMTTPLTVALVPSSIPSAAELCAKLDGLVASLELAAPPPIVMSEPAALD